MDALASMHLSEQEQQQINGLVAEVEAASGAQFVVAVVGKADAYPEIPWKAFALGTATAGLLVAFAGVLHVNKAILPSVMPALLIVLGAGLACAVTTVFVPAIARLLLDPLRAAVEVEQYARALFLDRRMFETRQRAGVLILISQFERQAVILTDVAVARHITDAQLEGIVSEMVLLLAQARIASAAETALRRIDRLLHGKLPRSVGGDELAEALVQERGA